MIKKFINFINRVFSRLFLFRKKVPKEDLLKFRDFLKDKIKITLNLLEKMKRFSPSFPTISSFESIEKSFALIRKVILEGLSRFEEKIRDLDEELVWDGLCVGFFGETNAGKSTLIEALICGDGASIGDGRKDFTREVKHFKYENINLIDMPGIEGNEESLKLEIEKAVRKAHIVFYIVNSTKEPERETLLKVKNYLNSKAEIYSIINVRLDVGRLRYKKTFEDDSVKKVAERTDSFMKEVFQERYKGYIICHALLGFFAKGSPNREDLKNYQKRAFEILGKNKKTILKISGLDKLENLIKNASKNINAEIVKSNTIEVISELSFTINRILENKKKFENDLKLAEISIKQKKEEIGNIIKKYEKEAPIKLGNFLDKKANELYEIVSEGIDNEWSDERIKEEVKRFIDKIEKELEEKVKEIKNPLKSEIEEPMKELSERISLLKEFTINLEFDFKEVFKNLEIGFFNVLKWIGEFILSIFFGFVAGRGLGAIIAGIVKIVKDVFSWIAWFLGFGENPKEKKKREAKSKALDEIQKDMDKIKKYVIDKMNKQFKDISKEFENKFREMEMQIQTLYELTQKFTEYINDLKKIQAEISTELCKLFLKKKDIMAYIDITNGKPYLYIIGLSNFDVKAFGEMLSIDANRIYCFKDIEDLKLHFPMLCPIFRVDRENKEK
ncbi:MAG: GTPase [Candidatus Hydrothermia bacterium]|jgi:hypothetical protein